MAEETPDQMFARLMPGVDISTAKRTKGGLPYVLETSEFEPGTFGQRSAGRPLVRLSPKARPQELEHELEHLRQLYGGTAGTLDEGYDEDQLGRVYQTQGLNKDESLGLAYGMRPSEVAARKAAGDPGDIFAQLMKRVEAIRASRAKPSGGQSLLQGLRPKRKGFLE